MSTPHVYNKSSTKARRRELRKCSTEAERKLWTILRSRHINGLKFIRQYSVGPYFLDFFCPQRRLAIEVDGGQHAEDDQRTHDEGRTAHLKVHDIRVLRFWNNEVLANPEGVAAKISEVLGNPPQPHVPPLKVRGGEGELRGEGELPSDRNPSQPPLTLRGGARRGFTLFELIIVIAIFLLISGMLLVNFRRSRQGDIVRIAALRLMTDVQRMQTIALAGGAEDRLAVAYGVHVNTAEPGRYVLFGDRIRCVEGAQGAEVCTANGQYDAGVNPAEELGDGVVTLPVNVRIADVRRVTPDAAVPAVDVLFQPPRGTVTIAPDATEVRVVLRHADYDDTRTVTMNRISGRVDVE